MAKSKRLSKRTKMRIRFSVLVSLVCIFYFIFCVGYELYKVHNLKMEELPVRYEPLVDLHDYVYSIHK